MRRSLAVLAVVSVSLVSLVSLSLVSACGNAPPPNDQRSVLAVPSGSTSAAPPTADMPWTPPAECHPAKPATGSLSATWAATAPAPPAPATPNATKPGAARPVTEVKAPLQIAAGNPHPSTDVIVDVSFPSPCAYEATLAGLPPDLRQKLTNLLGTRTALFDTMRGLQHGSTGEGGVPPKLVEEQKRVMALHVSVRRDFEAAPSPNASTQIARALLLDEEIRSTDDSLEIGQHLKPVVEPLVAGVTQTPIETPLGGWSRLVLARTLAATGEIEKARKIVDDLAQAPLGWANGAAVFHIADVYDQSGDHAHAADTLRAAKTLDPSPPFVAAVSARLMVLAVQARDWPALLARSSEWLAAKHDVHDLDIGPEARHYAALAIDHLGEPALAKLDGVAPDIVADVASHVAGLALARSDLGLAKAAWRTVALRAAGTPAAKDALAGLIAIAEREKDAAGAKDLRARWAKDVGAEAPVLPALHDATEVERLAALVRTCVRDEADARTVGSRVELDVKVEPFANAPPKVTSKMVAGFPAPLECLSREAPRYFAGAARGVHAKVVVTR